MSQATADGSSEFDYQVYSDRLLDALEDTLPDYLDWYPADPHTAVVETIFEIADSEVGHNGVSHSIAILQQSPHEPQEWEVFAEGKDDWRDVIRAMAFTVVRQDCYTALEEAGYLDDGWSETDKLDELRPDV